MARRSVSLLAALLLLAAAPITAAASLAALLLVAAAPIAVPRRPSSFHWAEAATGPATAGRSGPALQQRRRQSGGGAGPVELLVVGAAPVRVDVRAAAAVAQHGVPQRPLGGGVPHRGLHAAVPRAAVGERAAVARVARVRRRDGRRRVARVRRRDGLRHHGVDARLVAAHVPDHAPRGLPVLRRRGARRCRAWASSTRRCCTCSATSAGPAAAADGASRTSTCARAALCDWLLERRLRGRGLGRRGRRAHERRLRAHLVRLYEPQPEAAEQPERPGPAAAGGGGAGAAAAAEGAAAAAAAAASRGG